ncbi:MAG: hypothetical protein H7X71_05015, partial [Chitinophagales bacterium]|nr:hypothetical protein [Chitinophagales bacterium]
MKNLFTILTTLAFLNSIQAQIVITTSGDTYLVNFTDFDGSGFDPAPSDGQLDSDTWSVTGMSDGDLDFGGTATTGDLARGTSTGFETVSGLYAASIFGDQALMVQPADDDFTPGTIILKIENSTGAEITQLDAEYSIYQLNDKNSSSSFNFSYSPDNVSYTDIPALDYATSETADFSIFSEFKSTSLTGLSIAAGDYFYIRWKSDDVSGTGDRDEIALDNIAITGYAGAPEIVVSFTAPGETDDESFGT